MCIFLVTLFATVSHILLEVAPLASLPILDKCVIWMSYLGMTEDPPYLTTSHEINGDLRDNIFRTPPDAESSHEQKVRRKNPNHCTALLHLCCNYHHTGTNEKGSGHSPLDHTNNQFRKTRGLRMEERTRSMHYEVNSYIRNSLNVSNVAWLGYNISHTYILHCIIKNIIHLLV